MSGSAIENFLTAVVDSMKHVYFFVNEYGHIMHDTVSTTRKASEAKMKEEHPEFDIDTASFGCTLVKLDKSEIVWPMEKAEYVAGRKRPGVDVQAEGGTQ